ncbi:hypothetical protein GE21DRAFT_1051134 [Neurospora crassa]|nr:hypothetical protein GE21DRAFT_1051134 [Neurospora crassa]
MLFGGGLSQIHHSTAPRLCLTQSRDLRTGKSGASSSSTDNPTGPPRAILLFVVRRQNDDGIASIVKDLMG